MYYLRITYLIWGFLLYFGFGTTLMTAHAESDLTHNQNFTHTISLHLSTGETASPKRKVLLMAQAPSSAARKTASQKSNTANAGRRSNANLPTPNGVNGANNGNGVRIGQGNQSSPPATTGQYGALPNVRYGTLPAGDNGATNGVRAAQGQIQRLPSAPAGTGQYGVLPNVKYSPLPGSGQTVVAGQRNQINARIPQGENGVNAGVRRAGVPVARRVNLPQANIGANNQGQRGGVQRAGGAVLPRPNPQAQNVGNRTGSQKPVVQNIGKPESPKTKVSRFKRAVLNTKKTAKQVFNGPVVRRFRRSEQSITPINLSNINPKITLLDNWASVQFGSFIGGGANSNVYADKHGNPNIVYKVVRLNSSKAERTITDQLGGQSMLQLANYAIKGDSLFKVAAGDSPKVYRLEGPNGNSEFVAVSRSANISSPVFDKNGQAIRDRNNNPILASNAYVRAGYRDAKKLNQKEELTINLAIRKLNNKGIVWTDHKLKNLDVVRDKKSPTGYRVVFFDFDGFRAVNGIDSKSRKQAARELQKQFDDVSLGYDGKPVGPNISGKFDYTAFGNSIFDGDTVVTPNANKNRLFYLETTNDTALDLRLKTQSVFNNDKLTRSIELDG